MTVTSIQVSCDYCGDGSGETHYIRGNTYTRDDGYTLIELERHTGDGSGILSFSTGYCTNQEEAEQFASWILELKDKEIMNLLKNDKLFPNIRGVMLKDKPVTLHLSGKVKITELQGGDARVELYFSDHKKTAVINRNQALQIIEHYGPETDDWKGKPVVLYAEEGTWFGKHQWGIRVNGEASAKAWQYEQKEAGKAKRAKGEEKPQPLEEAQEEIEQAIATQFDELREQDIEQLAADLFDDPNAGAYAE